MIEGLKRIAEDMRELGLAALAHVNNARLTEDRWSGVLSVLQTAHAMEILAKARIAEEHPLLLFDSYPRPQKDKENKIIGEITVDQLSTKGRTIEWSDIVETLWLVAGIKSVDIQTFEKFGKIRNAIQHFGIAPGEQITYLMSLNFIYEMIDPFINECWDLYAVDFCQDNDDEVSEEENCSYWSFIKECLIQNEIRFLVSPRLAQNAAFWWEPVKEEPSKEYAKYIQAQIDKANLPV